MIEIVKMNKDKRIVHIDWLDECSNCGNRSFNISTFAVNGSLNTLDNVMCECGNSGYIDVMDDGAFVCWDELSEDEIRYNKLKIMYDKAIVCLMESNYGDVKYLRNRGVIE